MRKDTEFLPPSDYIESDNAVYLIKNGNFLKLIHGWNNTAFVYAVTETPLAVLIPQDKIYDSALIPFNRQLEYPHCGYASEENIYSAVDFFRSVANITSCDFGTYGNKEQEIQPEDIAIEDASVGRGIPDENSKWYTYQFSFRFKPSEKFWLKQNQDDWVSFYCESNTETTNFYYILKCSSGIEYRYSYYPTLNERIMFNKIIEKYNNENKR